MSIDWKVWGPRAGVALGAIVTASSFTDYIPGENSLANEEQSGNTSRALRGALGVGGLALIVSGALDDKRYTMATNSALVSLGATVLGSQIALEDDFEIQKDASDLTFYSGLALSSASTSLSALINTPKEEKKELKGISKFINIPKRVGLAAAGSTLLLAPYVSIPEPYASIPLEVLMYILPKVNLIETEVYEAGIDFNNDGEGTGELSMHKLRFFPYGVLKSDLEDGNISYSALAGDRFRDEGWREKGIIKANDVDGDGLLDVEGPPFYGKFGENVRSYYLRNTGDSLERVIY